MGWFKKKPSEVDLRQDATLKDIIKKLNQMSKYQGILITNNNANLEEKKKLWKWINKLVADNQTLLKHIQVLEAESVKNRERDEALAARFKNLGSVMVSETEVATDE